MGKGRLGEEVRNIGKGREGKGEVKVIGHIRRGQERSYEGKRIREGTAVWEGEEKKKRKG